MPILLKTEHFNRNSLYTWRNRGRKSCENCLMLEGITAPALWWMVQIQPGWHDGCDCRLEPCTTTHPSDLDWAAGWIYGIKLRARKGGIYAGGHRARIKQGVGNVTTAAQRALNPHPNPIMPDFPTYPQPLPEWRGDGRFSRSAPRCRKARQ